MPLSTSQQTTLVADIAANTATVEWPVGSGQQVQIKNIPHTSDGSFSVAAWYNLFPQVNFFAYYNNVPLAAVKGAIAWKKLTPTDAVPTDTALNVQIWNARSMACQGCQFNVQMLLGTGQQTIGATQNKVVQGFLDALSTVPSGVGGAAVDAGWLVANGVQSVLCRLSTNVEKLFASTANGNGAANTTPASLVFQGTLQPSDVSGAWGI